MPQGPSFWFDTRIYLAVTAVALLIISYYNPYAATLGAILLYALYLYGRERYTTRQKEVNNYLKNVCNCIDTAAGMAFANLPLAILLIDEYGVIHWHNELLAEWLAEPIENGQSIAQIWPTLPLDKLVGKDGQTKFETGAQQHYDIVHRVAEHEALTVLYISDVTESEADKAAGCRTQTVLAYIQIDNYNDALTGLNESQRTAILGEVNRMLAEWMTELDGHLKKYNEDTYIAVLNRYSLDRLMTGDKFEILDRIRGIQAGNKIPVTLSIGAATGESSVAELGQRAQAGLDLALSRGGDQAAVNISGKVQFFGGKAKAVEKNTRVKARIVAQAIRELIDQADSIVVMGHTGEDFDSLGAALGVAKMVRHMGKQVKIVVSQPGMAVDKLSELLLDYEEYRELFISPMQAGILVNAKTLVFVVDTHRPELVAAPEVLARAERTVIIDHHRRAETIIANTLLVYLEPSASSTSELVTELLGYFDDRIDLNRLEASALYAGLVVDTKNFAVQTGVRTFEAASYLRRSGADPTLVRHLFRVDFETMKSRAAIIENTEMPHDGVVIAVCPADIKNAQIAAAQVADMLLSIEGIRVSFVLFNIENGIGISARSNGDINVQVIMEQLGGGGHQSVAGAKIKNTDTNEVKAKIIEIVDSYIKESVTHESNSAARSEKAR
ncbi:DHH family phosphoesterase [Sporomusa acidovorans]|uniref:Cyclic-di-AMP phosphodiesterase n=1 Tax=Sporomusa acidovorans (strain ATCC 49682 / DSM 3132 / Mol) TaxID=1123286 RepID=A0ABZ3JBR9_SPOA4|nr:DHH family phosphoesterase [Sporomusa acidovorans]OZC22699.1 bifunctional oligoribonuclease and PAP phosphatase NrnA [Sporomusa acidovorans DSM 3132]SDE79133.1 c-di-AMP phosphodiesterase, consists of a GGDEF-like and DHH domains [Sporomusa acidovorans]